MAPGIPFDRVLIWGAIAALVAIISAKLNVPASQGWVYGSLLTFLIALFEYIRYNRLREKHCVTEEEWW